MIALLAKPVQLNHFSRIRPPWSFRGTREEVLFPSLSFFRQVGVTTAAHSSRIRRRVQDLGGALDPRVINPTPGEPTNCNVTYCRK